MNTIFRPTLALLALCTAASAQNTPFLATPDSLFNKTGHQKADGPNAVQPLLSSRDDLDGPFAGDRNGSSEPRVVRFYVLNVVPNEGQLKPERRIAPVLPSHERPIDDRIVNATVADDDISGFAAVDSENLLLVSGQGLNPVPQRVLEPSVEPVQPPAEIPPQSPANQPLPYADAAPSLAEPPIALPDPDVAPMDASPGNSSSRTTSVRPEMLAPLSSIQLAAVIPRSTGESSTLPENKALSMNGGENAYLDQTPPARQYYPQRNAYPIYHNPLYFEDPNLERCGQTNGCLTEVASIMHFAGRVPILPYLMTVNHPRSCVLAKPDCPTCSEFAFDAYVPHPDELDLGGATVQALATVGLIFLIP